MAADQAPAPPVAHDPFDEPDFDDDDDFNEDDEELDDEDDF